MSRGFHSAWWQGTAAERGAFSTTLLAVPFFWYETDTRDTYQWDGVAWLSIDVGGSGVANQVAYWTGPSIIAGDAGFTYNAGTNTVTVGAIVVASGGDVNPADASGQELGDPTHRWDLHTQDVYFGGATGANITHIPDNLAEAWKIRSGDGLQYMVVVTTDAQPMVVFNDASVDIDFIVGAAGAITGLQVRGSDGQITLGVLGAGAVQSTAGGVLSSGPLPLVDLADWTQGDLIYGNAAGWQDLAHPGAANRVLQSTAAEVGWSANAVTFPTAGAVPIGTGAANRVAYWSAANTLASDAGLLVDAANDFYLVADTGGIGNSAATARIEFNSAGAQDHVAVMGAFLGVGLAAPGYVVDVLANAADQGFRITNTGGHAWNRIDCMAAREAGFIFQAATVSKWALYKSAGNDFIIYSYATTHVPFQIQVDDDVILCNGGGNVGIGIAAPLARLHADQSAAGGAIPVAIFNQGDVSEQHIVCTMSGADVDFPAILQLAVTGTPSLGWAEAADEFTLSKGLQMTGGDLVFMNAGSGLSYAEIYAHAVAVDLALAAQDTFYQIVAFNTDGQSNNCTPDHTNDHVTVVEPGDYHVSLSWSGHAHNLDDYDIHVKTNNGTVDCENVTIHTTTAVAGRIITSAAVGVCAFSATDTVEVWVQRTTGGAVEQTLTTDHINLTVVQVGG